MVNEILNKLENNKRQGEADGLQVDAQTRGLMAARVIYIGIRIDR